MPGAQVRGFPCDCRFPESCDSQGSQLPPTRAAARRQEQGQQQGQVQGPQPEEQQQQQGQARQPEQQQQQVNGKEEQRQEPPGSAGVPGGEEAAGLVVRRLEDLHVNEVYNAIAPHFSATRCARLFPPWQRNEV
jgi:hypothetical protein